MTNFLSNNNFSVYIQPGIPAQVSPCPDQHVGIYNKSGFKYLPSRINIDYQKSLSGALSIVNQLNNPVVIILESPHIEEFKVPLGPAKGTTGRLFENGIHNFHTLIQRSTIYSTISSFFNIDIIFINAVQFQCSLGNKLNKANTIIRDNNWIQAFNNGFSQDVVDRIKAINPISVINLCTKGYLNMQLLLHEVVKVYTPYTFGTHPSTWNFAYARIF